LTVDVADPNAGIKGRCASPGHAVGPLLRLGFASPQELRPEGNEAAALRVALALAARDLARLATRVPPGGADCLEFQLALLDDETLVAPVFAALGQSGADVGWRRMMDDLIGVYRLDPSAYVQARALDVADLRDRVLSALHGDSPAPAPAPGAIIVADDLPPSRFLELDWSQGGGIALSRGSELSHTAILARALGVPMLVQAGAIPEAKCALLDADRGRLHLDPAPAALRAFAPPPARKQSLDLAAPATYRGQSVRLLLNIEGPENLLHPMCEFADGIGLMRTEFLFLGVKQAPDEQAQYEAYCAVLRWARGRPVTIRTVDAGGDKAIAGYSEEGEANPALGLRGLRLSLKRREAFATQLRALARAAATGDLKVMFPFVTTPCEFDVGRALFRQVVEDLQREGAPARMPELGMMVETPAAALTLPSFDAAFFSIGANDLAQFVLACDRANGAVSSLYDPMHPAVVELLRRIVADARAVGRNVSLCGDVAADPGHTLALLNCGLRELSMSANALAAVKSALLQNHEARDV